VVEVDIPPVPVGTTRIHEKFKKLIDSATDTQLIHNCVLDLLPAHVYFRLNPYMSAPYTLDGNNDCDGSTACHSTFLFRDPARAAIPNGEGRPAVCAPESEEDRGGCEPARQADPTLEAFVEEVSSAVPWEVECPMAKPLVL